MPTFEIQITFVDKCYCHKKLKVINTQLWFGLNNVYIAQLIKIQFFIIIIITELNN
jgi:hypothetical protein